MKKRHFIKIGIVLLVVGVMSFSDWSFAADSNKLDLLNEVSKLLHIAVSILSWIWVFFAQGAGEFLTNKWVYGEILGLDVVLWKYWNVTKNIANFGLGFYFMYLIFTSLIGKGDVIKDLKSKVLYLLLAGIGIQSSWFLTAVVLDISTITLATAGSFPSLVASEVEEVDKGFELSLENYLELEGSLNELQEGMEFSLFSPDMGASNFITVKKIPLKEKMTKKEIYDEIMPNSDDVSGPLYYLGFSILRVTTIISPNSSDDKGWMSTIFNTLLQGGTTIVFSIEMLVLLVIAVMRLLYMWVFIVLSPIVVLLWCIKKGGGKLGDGKGFLDGFSTHFNITSFFWNAFKPTLIVLGFSVAMIFMTLMNKIIISNGNKELDMGGMKASMSVDKSAPKTGNPGDKQWNTVMDGDTAGIIIRDAGKTIFNFILSVITVVLVYIIIKYAVNMGGGKDFLSKGIKKFQSNVESGIGVMPLVPVSGWDENGNPETHYISVGKTFGFGMNKGEGGLISRQITEWNRAVQETVNKDTDSLNELFGWDDEKKMSAANWGSIRGAGDQFHGLKELEEKKKVIENLSKNTKTGWGFMLNPNTGDKRWIDEFTEWLKKTKEEEIPSSFDGVSLVYIKVWKDMVRRWKTDGNKNKSLKDMFLEVPNSVKAYAEFFGLDKKIERWLQLQDEDISKPKESEEESGEKSE